VSLIPGEPLLVYAPSSEDPRLVPWLTHADVGYLDQFDFGPLVNMVASDLAGTIKRRTLAQRIRNQCGLGLALYPQLYLLQLREEKYRSYFADAIALLGEPLEESVDPIRELLDDATTKKLAEQLIDLAIEGSIAW